MEECNEEVLRLGKMSRREGVPMAAGTARQGWKLINLSLSRTLEPCSIRGNGIRSEGQVWQTASDMAEKLSH